MKIATVPIIALRSGLMFAVFALLLVASDGFAAEAGLRSSIEKVLAEEGLTGIAWVLIEGDSQVSLGAAGLRDQLEHTAFTTDTRFHVGSITKSLLATGVLRLATEGVIDLDAPVSRYLPDLSLSCEDAGQAGSTAFHCTIAAVTAGATLHDAELHGAG